MQTASHIYYNGTIITMDSRISEVEAIAIANDSILAVGTKAEVCKYQDNNTIMIDLKGNTMLPGFIDSHSHYALAGKQYASSIDFSSPPMGTITSIEEILAKIEEVAKTAPKGTWICGSGYKDSALKENRHPTRQELDRVCPNNPVIVSHSSVHTAVVNSKALELANVTESTKNPEGGVYRRNEDGIMNGIIEGFALYPIMGLLPKDTEESWLNGIKESSRRYSAKGVTSAQEGACNEEVLKYLKLANEQGILKQRIQISPIVTDLMGPSFKNIEALKVNTAGSPLSDDNMLSLGAIKMLTDGGVPVYTAFMSNPYHNPENFCPDPLWRGYPTTPYWKLEDDFIKYHRQGYQIAVHANGDDGAQYILDACEAAQKRYPRADAKHIILHSQNLREDQFDRIKRLGMIPSFFVAHVYYWGDRIYNTFLGEDRAIRTNACNSAVVRRIPFTIHNDSPVTPMNPLLNVWTAVNRVTSSGMVLGKAQQISVKEALKAITINAAYQACQEEIKGSLEPNKLADMVIVDKNPLAIDPMEIKDIKIITTLVGNNIIYGNLPE